MGLRRRTVYGLLWIYKHGPSQVFQLAGARCQHTPTCSEYGAECVARHGWWPGGWMTLARLLRCHPIAVLGGSSGIDNVPNCAKHAPFWAPWRYGVWRHNSEHESGKQNEHDHSDIS